MNNRKLLIALSTIAVLVVGATGVWALNRTQEPVVMDEPAEAPVEAAPVIQEPEPEPLPKMLVFTSYGTKTAVRTDLVRTITESPKGTFISWEGQDTGTIAEEPFDELLSRLNYATNSE